MLNKNKNFLNFTYIWKKTYSKKLLKYLDSRFFLKFLNRLSRSTFTIFSFFFFCWKNY